MKRLILLPFLFIFVALFATVTALMQDSLRPQLNTRDLPQVAQAQDALPQKHLNQNRLHKLIIKSEDGATYAELMRLNAGTTRRAWPFLPCHALPPSWAWIAPPGGAAPSEDLPRRTAPQAQWSVE